MGEATNHTAYLTDHWTTQDELHFSDYRSALLNILMEAQTPLTVGVFGPWGSGKTSLLRMLKEKVEERRSPHFRTVWFTAWKYDRNEALWRTFILRVLDALYPRVDGDDPWEKRQRIPIEDLGQGQKEQVECLDRLSRSLYGAVEWHELGRWVMDWQKVGKELAKIPAFLLLGAGKLAEALGIAPDMDLVQREVQTYRLEQLASMEQFEATFKEALTLILGEEGRLIVFVDDLDRCLPEKAVDVLEAIKLFLEVEGTVFVLGMDTEVIERGIEARYKDFLLQGVIEPEKDVDAGLPIRGSVYLQKIVQIPFHLPPLAVENLAEYIQVLEKNVPSSARLSDMTRAVFAHGLLPNPRQVKRALNIFHLLREIALEREERPENEGGLRKGSIAWPLLAKAVLIQTQWPELYQDWRQYPVLVQMLEAEYTDQPYTQEEAIRGRAASPSGQSGDKREGDIQAGGLLEPYLRNRDRLLGQMLTFPKEDQAGKGRELARFAGLSRQEMAVYVRLAAVASPEEPSVGIPGDLLAELRSDDRGRVQDAAARLTEEIIIGEAQAEQVAAWVQEQEPERDGPVRQALQERLQYAMRSPARVRSAQVRVSAGDSLALLGDPRFRPDVWYMRDDPPLLGFVKIEEGSFLMGEGDERHKITLPTYYIVRYPVTVAQFRAYARDIGPERESAVQGLDNHPVVEVNWNEALGYCQWLKEKLLGWQDAPEPLKTLLREKGWTITLPSEAEWEKAARGALQMADGLTIGGVDGLRTAFQGENPESARMYPWGDKLDPEWANYAETGIGTTSAVGCFLDGVSPYGVEDLSGNIWEWTRSLWGRNGRRPDFEYPYDPKDGRENLEADQLVRRVLRGGAFNNEGRDVRCTHRISNYPDKHGKEMGFRVVLSYFESNSMDS